MLRENPHGTDPAGESIPFKLCDQLVEKEGEECCNAMVNTAAYIIQPYALQQLRPPDAAWNPRPEAGFARKVRKG
jgi:hypothetical protein